MGNLVTTFHIKKGSYDVCSLEKWCENAHDLHRIYNTSSIVLTNNVHVVQTICPFSQVIPFDVTLSQAIDKFKVKGFTCKDTLYKLHILNRQIFTGPVIYLDADVDVSLPVALDRRNVSHVLELFHAWKHSSCVICGTADHSALINDGVMLVKPNENMYARALHILNHREFNNSFGFEFKGLPQTVIEHPLKIVTKSRGYWANTWNFVCGAGGQGLFAYLSMTTNSFCVPKFWNIRVRHFWANDKPWKSNSCRPYYLTQSRSDLCRDFLRAKRVASSGKCLGRNWPIL